MLTCFALDGQGVRHSLPAPKSLILCQESDTPADSLTAVFGEVISTELAEIYVYDGEKLVYSGIVDEQITLVDTKLQTEIISRSMAALLLDNEAVPQSFTEPSAEIIFRRYIKPCGIDAYHGEDAVCHGEFKAAKGMSCWQVTEEFCRNCYGMVPRVTGKEINLKGITQKDRVVFSNDGTAVPYTKLEYNRMRCKLISRVRAKTIVGGEYSTVISNEDAVSRGVHRERYINATLLSSTPLSKADEMLKSSKAKSESVTLHCPLRLTDVLGAQAQVRDKAAGELTDFYITGIRYTLSDRGETTRITLGRKER